MSSKKTIALVLALLFSSMLLFIPPFEGRAYQKTEDTLQKTLDISSENNRIMRENNLILKQLVDEENNRTVQPVQ